MAELQLQVVPAFYLAPAGDKLLPVDPANALLASDFAPKWNAWRADVKNIYGWEILVSPPAEGRTYTRAMFRTPQDQAALQDAGNTAAAIDSSAHQAGRGVDVDLAGMQQIYKNYSYSNLVSAAKRAGILNRVSSEPWHFDDNPADIFGSTRAAIEKIGNLTGQVQTAIMQGLDSPQAAAVKAYLGAAAKSPWWILAVLGLAAYALLGGGEEEAQHKQRRT